MLLTWGIKATSLVSWVPQQLLINAAMHAPKSQLIFIELKLNGLLFKTLFNR